MVMRICERRRSAIIQPAIAAQTRNICAISSVQASGALIWRDTTPSTTQASSASMQIDGDRLHQPVGERDQYPRHVSPY